MIIVYFLLFVVPLFATNSNEEQTVDRVPTPPPPATRLYTPKELSVDTSNIDFGKFYESEGGE